MLASRQDASSGMMSPAASIWEIRLAWLIMQPFGLPVVPEVKKIAARSSEGRVHALLPLSAPERGLGGEVSLRLPGSHHCTVRSSGAQGGGSAPSTTISLG